MSDPAPSLTGPDFAAGIPLSEIADGSLTLGHAHGEQVVLARQGDDLFAVGATCSHWGGPLADGLLDDDTVRCPWHHACFSLRTGEPLRSPALDPVSCWRVETAREPARPGTTAGQRGGRVFVREKQERVARPRPMAAGAPRAVVIVGGGAAGNAAAETLRREGYAGRITMLS